MSWSTLFERSRNTMAMCDSSRISDQPQLFRKYQIEEEVFVLNTYGGVLSKIKGEDIVVQSLLTECETYDGNDRTACDNTTRLDKITSSPGAKISGSCG